MKFKYVVKYGVTNKLNTWYVGLNNSVILIGKICKINNVEVTCENSFTHN